MFRVLEELKQPSVPSHQPGISYDCDLCESGDWLSETEVDIHKRTTHKREMRRKLAKENVCTACGLELENKEALIAHAKTIHLHSSSTARRVERELFFCHHCGDLFFNKDFLAAHIVHKHKNKVALNCPCCTKLLKPSLAYGHLTACHSFHSVSLCPVCVTKRPNRSELTAHMRSHRKHYHCAICGYMSTKERDFNIHLDKYEGRAFAPAPRLTDRCFMPGRLRPRADCLRSRPVLAGASVPRPLHICVLCRHICEEEDMEMHIAQQHTVSPSLSPAHACSCGAVFANRILLKHHVFKTPGHRALKNGELPDNAETPSEVESKDTQSVETSESSDQQMRHTESSDECSQNAEAQRTESQESEGTEDEKYLVIVTEPREAPSVTLETSVVYDDDIPEPQLYEEGYK